MLQASEKIDADIFADLRVVQTVRRDVNQRGGAAPVLVGRICQKKFRCICGFYRSVKETSGVAALGIGFRKVSEGKQICWKENAGERLSVARRLSKTMIEAA